MLARLPGRSAIIVDTPDAGRDVPACLSAHQDDVDACAIPRSRRPSGTASATSRRSRRRQSGGGLIDLTARICVGDGACPVVVNDMIVYRDHSHLTATFSRSLAPALGAAIASLGARTATTHPPSSGQGRRQPSIRSTIVAIPCPTPMHIVARP